MKHDLRAVTGEDLRCPGLVLCIADHRHDCDVRIAVAKLLLDGIQREFRNFEKQDSCRGKARDLATQLRANRSPGAGDQYHLPLQQAM